MQQGGQHAHASPTPEASGSSRGARHSRLGGRLHRRLGGLFQRRGGLTGLGQQVFQHGGRGRFGGSQGLGGLGFDRLGSGRARSRTGNRASGRSSDGTRSPSS